MICVYSTTDFDILFTDQIVAEMDELRTGLSSRDCEIASNRLIVENLKVDNESLQNESQQLRNKLIQLVKLVPNTFFNLKNQSNDKYHDLSNHVLYLSNVNEFI